MHGSTSLGPGTASLAVIGSLRSDCRLSCFDQALAASKPPTDEPVREGGELRIERGVSCTGVHPAFFAVAHRLWVPTSRILKSSSTTSLAATLMQGRGSVGGSTPNCWIFVTVRTQPSSSSVVRRLLENSGTRRTYGRAGVSCTRPTRSY